MFEQNGDLVRPGGIEIDGSATVAAEQKKPMSEPLPAEEEFDADPAKERPVISASEGLSREGQRHRWRAGGAARGGRRIVEVAAYCWRTWSTPIGSGSCSICSTDGCPHGSTRRARRSCGGGAARGVSIASTSPSFISHALRPSWPRLEPAQHDAVEGVGMLDIGEMPGVGDLLVAAAGDELGDALVAGGRRALIIGAADHQRRHLERRQIGDEVEILDRRGAAEKSRRRGADDGVADLLASGPGCFALKASVNQRSIVPSASGGASWRPSPPRRAAPRSPAAPGGVAGNVSHDIAEMSRCAMMRARRPGRSCRRSTGR